MNTRILTTRRNGRPWAAAVGTLALLLPLSITSLSPAQTSAKATPAKESFEGEQQWRTFFNEAKLAYGDKRWAEAKSLYLKASAIKVTPKILGNLAQVEIQLGEYRAAAAHATEALADPGKSPGSVEDLAIASKYVGKLLVGVNVEGATIKIDGEELGVATPGKAFFVDPGMRKLVVSKEGYLPSEKELVAQKGSEQRVDFELVVDPGPKATASAPMEPVQPKPPEQKPLLATPVEEPRIEPAKPSPIVLIAGGVVTVGGLVTGLVFNSKANSKYDEAKAIRNEVGPSGCYGSTSAQCALGHERLVDGDRSRNIAIAAFAVGGVALVGTIAYWVWPRTKPPSPHNELRFTAGMAPGNTWLGVSRDF